ncbi:hypothetical protein QYM36_018866 [Artemia franciscana]|uniref:Uncharacterized protein n=1 Tax=Artemia franciscana TaxID=6661 RepID=A0AA88HBM0_ARTSF|nr:hypothetical protein QYM36_018863 [Artemia franciscana]KAK2702525.1 hypothetical protein QYM36_018864 [Artemia franciscana]KAK2702526.1 hypothetical protein QYM36_018865 [Artemia franciscana]KAK2702527.1 hypothetical protein QYM36_018866 [Artemia franciscana]
MIFTRNGRNGTTPVNSKLLDIFQYITRIWTSCPSPIQALKSEILDSNADECEVVFDEMKNYKNLMKVKANSSAYPDESHLD